MISLFLAWLAIWLLLWSAIFAFVTAVRLLCVAVRLFGRVLKLAL